jgi:hypothetical protein
MIARNSRYSDGSGTKPSVFARGKTISQAPAATMIAEVTIRGQSTRLSISGILLVRMTWMIDLWVKIAALSLFRAYSFPFLLSCTSEQALGAYSLA